MRYINNIRDMKRGNLMLSILGFLVVVLLAVSGFLAWKYYNASKNQKETPASQSTRVTQEVSKIYEVPTDEQPTVAVIQDKTKLDNQEFFKKVQNGDYLLLYKKAKLALVYRESINKLVTVGPINISDNNQKSTTSTAPTNTTPTTTQQNP